MSKRPRAASGTLRHLKLQAKRLLEAARAAEPAALRRFNVLGHRLGGPRAAIRLADAQLAIAREWGLPSWAKLKLRAAELDLAGAEAGKRLNALVDAMCAWGWDHASAAAAPLAEALLAPATRETQDDFLVACLAGEAEAVRRMLDADPDLARRALAPRGWSAILYVSYCVLLRQSGRRASAILEVAQLLLARGADPNSGYTSENRDAKANPPFTALYASIAVSKSLELARLLLEAGANPTDSQSMYHAAERWDIDALELLHVHGVSRDELSYCLFHKLDIRHEEGIRWFLDHGAKPDQRHPRCQENFLHWAIKRGCSTTVIEWLIVHGVDPNARTAAGLTAYPTIRATTPLDLAERLGRMEVAALLRRHGGESTPAANATDEFVLACARADAPAARRMLDADPSLLSRLSEEDRALPAHIAQQNERAPVELMLALGFDPDVHGWLKFTPLHWAACRGNPLLIRALLARGARVQDIGQGVGTPLHTALHCRWQRGGDYAGAVTELVAGGLDLPDVLEPTGDAALDEAVARLRQRGT